MVQKKKRKRRCFRVFFGGAAVGTIEAESVQRCIAKLGLVYCTGQKEPARRRCPGRVPHGHIPPRFFDPTPLRRGERDVYIARLPLLGEFSFEAAHLPPPAVTFREVPPAV